MLNFALIMAICVASLVVIMIVAMHFEQRALPKADPEKILADRFAKGEIDEAEYSRRLAILRYGPPIELPD